MPISTDQYSIKALFDQKQTFVVPKYQRGYAWNDEAVNDFIDDMSECLEARLAGTAKNHFFGGVVTIRREIVGSTRDNYEVIDGQQRLASFVLLAGCIVECITETLVDMEGNGELDNSHREAQTYLSETSTALSRLYLTFRDNKGIQYSDVPKLVLSNADDHFFRSVAVGRPPGQAVRDSHKRILFAWAQLGQFVQSKIFAADLGAPEKAIRLQKFLDGVLGRDCTAIFMCSDERSEAYQIFQVLNDRGVQLGRGDLLRARTLELLDDEALLATQNELAGNWDDILAYEPRVIDDYLLWYFSSVEGRRPKPVDLADEFLEHRFQCKDSDAVNAAGAQRILAETEDLNTAFAKLATMHEGHWPWTDNAGVTTWSRERLRMLVAHLQHTNALPLLLSLTTLDPKKFAEAVASIERFVFRYKTIVNAHITPLTNVYLKHARTVRQSKRYSVRRLRADLTELVNKYAPDSIFEPALREIRYMPRRSNVTIRYFLIAMEDYGRWAEAGARGTPKCRDQTRVFDLKATTIEHIYPQNSTLGDIDSELEGIKHTVGNLTILGPGDNQDLANFPPEDKLPEFAGSNLRLNRKISENDSWTKEIVEARTDQLVATALKIFIP